MVTPRGRAYTRLSPGRVFGGALEPPSARFSAVMEALAWAGGADIAAAANVTFAAALPAMGWSGSVVASEVPEQPTIDGYRLEPAITGEPQPPDPYFLDDQGSGPNYQYSNSHLLIAWTNPSSGDWKDANGTNQGTVPFASTLTPTAGAYYNVNAASIVARLLVNGNQGIRLRGVGSGPVLICTGRLGANPPTLTVVTDAGTFNCACLSSPAWTNMTTSALTQNSTAQFQFDASQFHAAVRFDLTAVTGTVISATLSLYVQSRFGTGTGIGLFEMIVKPFVLGIGTSATPVLGLAAAVGEANLADHPDVLMAGDFAGTTLTPSGISAGAFVPKLFGNVSCHVDNSPDIVADPDAPGTVMWRGKFVPVSGSTDPKRGAFDGTFLMMPGDNVDPLGPPANLVTEAYYRMYVRLGEDFGTANDGNKMAITWDLRLGYWAGTYWQNVTGNGGSRGDGKRYTQFIGGKTRYVYQGHMERMEAGQAAVGSPTPVSEYRPILGYNYHIDQAGPFPGGASDPLGGVSYAKFLEAKFQKGRWYCIEQYLKMNTIDMTSPDAEGNGEANADGILRTWINGVMTDEQTTYRWRRHPQMGIGGVNANWYLGGVQTTTQTMTWAMNHLVVAAQYIGPRVAPVVPIESTLTLPAPGVIGTLGTSVLSDTSTDSTETFSLPYVLGHWCTATVVLEKAGDVVTDIVYLMFGDGHNGTLTNDGVYAWRASTQQFVRLLAPTKLTPATATNLTYGENDIVGRPGAQHTYSHMQGLNSDEANGPAMMQLYGSGIEQSAAKSGQAHRFDLETEEWARWGSLAAVSTLDVDTVLKDTLRQVFVRYPSNNGTTYFVADYTQPNPTWDQRTQTTRTGGWGGVQNAVVVYDRIRDLDIGGIHLASPGSNFRAISSSNRDGAWVELTFGGIAPGAIHSQELQHRTADGHDEFILVDQTTTPPTGVWVLTPPASSPLTNPWIWSRRAFTGTSQYQNQAGAVYSYGRFKYIEALDALVVCPRPGAPMEVWKL